MGTFPQGCEADHSPHLKLKLQIHGAIPQPPYVPYCLIKCGEIHYEAIPVSAQHNCYHKVVHWRVIFLSLRILQTQWGCHTLKKLWRKYYCSQQKSFWLIIGFLFLLYFPFHRFWYKHFLLLPNIRTSLVTEPVRGLRRNYILTGIWFVLFS
jgi:hypothetical protein